MSGIPTYPIPETPPDEGQIAESLSFQGERLRPVLARLAEEVMGSLEEQQRAIDKVTAAVKRRIQTSLRGQVKLLTPVMDAIHGAIAGSLAAQQVALATLMDQVPAPGQTGYGPATAPLYSGGQAPVPTASAALPPGWDCGDDPSKVRPDLFANCTVQDGHWYCLNKLTGQYGPVCHAEQYGGGSPQPPPSGSPVPIPPQYPLPAPEGPPPTPAPQPVPPPPQGPGTPPGQPQPQQPLLPATSEAGLLPLVPDWCSADVCLTLDEVTSQVGQSGQAQTLSQIMAGLTTDAGAEQGGWLSWLVSAAVGQAAGVSAKVLGPVLDWVEKAATKYVVGPDCSLQGMESVWVARGLAGFAEQWLGVGLGPFVRKLDYWINAYCPSVIPSPAEADAIYMANEASEGQWRCWVRANGICDEPRSLLVEAQRTRPDVRQEYNLWLRGSQSEEELLVRLRALGILHPEDEQRLRSLTLQLPAPSELVQWVVREAFDLDVVKRWGYDAERPDVAAPFFRAQGLYGEYQRVGSVTGQTDTTDHLGMTWASHWQPISPTQAYEILHRVRPDTVADLQAIGLNVQPFTLDDVRSWIKIADYPEGIRDYLIATAFQPLRLIDIRNALVLGVRDKEWVYRQFLSRGLSPQDATFAADLAERQAYNRQRAPVVALERKALTWFVSEVQDSYELGTVSREDATQVLMSAGLSDVAAGAALDARDSRARRKLVNRAVSSVRRDYLAGAVSLQEAAQALTSAGVQPAQGNRYLELWSIELGHARRVVSTQKTIQWLTEGLITRDDAERRLANLGWSNTDVMTYLAEAQLKVSKQQAQFLKARAASERQQAKQLEQLQKQSQATADKARARLAKLTPVGKLQKWYASGYITDAFVQQRMAAMGYNAESIALHLEEFRAAREKTLAAETGKANGQPKP